MERKFIFIDGDCKKIAVDADEICVVKQAETATEYVDYVSIVLKNGMGYTFCFGEKVEKERSVPFALNKLGL